MKDRFHLFFVALFAVLIGLLFLQEPGFGDDLTYWSFAFDLHERGLAAWQRHSFHDLRWPVWGVSWVLQNFLGFGVASYYGVPIVYLTLGAIAAFIFGRRVFDQVSAGWACSAVFLFQPLLDSVCFRPMPDLSEGVLGAGVMLAWWAMMHTQLGQRAIWFAILTGVGVYVAESNRITGAFIVPVLVVNTLLFFRNRFFWLIVAGGVAVVCYAGEMWFYHRIFGDWLHNIHANLGGAGNKGTEPIPTWYLPFRFVDTLWKGNLLAPVYCILAVLGLIPLWKNRGTLGRVLIVWFVILYLEYSCAPQSIWPWRPMIRDADRFLCGLLIPLSVLVVAGLWFIAHTRIADNLYASLRRRLGDRRAPAWAVGVVAVIALWVLTSRNGLDLGFVPEFRAYMRSLPPSTRVFSHEAMRAIAFLCDSESAKRIEWHAPRRSILHRDPGFEEQAAHCNEFWYARKLVWLNTRKQLERGNLPKQPPLASYFDAPERTWALTRLLAKGDTPDLIFYRRRTPTTPPPIVLAANAPELGGIIPALPAEWTPKSPLALAGKWNIPDKLRGKLARFEVEAASPDVEAFNVRLKFKEGKTLLTEYLLKPYLHAEGGKEFFALPIPETADSCDVQLKFSSKKAKLVRFTGFRAVLESPPPAP